MKEISTTDRPVCSQLGEQNISFFYTWRTFLFRFCSKTIALKQRHGKSPDIILLLLGKCAIRCYEDINERDNYYWLWKAQSNCQSENWKWEYFFVLFFGRKNKKLVLLNYKPQVGEMRPEMFLGATSSIALKAIISFLNCILSEIESRRCKMTQLHVGNKIFCVDNWI